MKEIDEYQIGDTVVMHMTGIIITRFVGKCISTKKEPIEWTPQYDHPRFEIIGILDEGGVEDAGYPYQGTILKPGDYIIGEEFNA